MKEALICLAILAGASILVLYAAAVVAGRCDDREDRNRNDLPG